MFRKNCISQMNKGVHYQQGVLCALPAFCLVLWNLTGCGETTAPATAVTLNITDDGFLTFSGGGEADHSEIERLNDEIGELIEEYQATLDDDEQTWTVTSTLSTGDRILQGTIYISKEESTLLSGDVHSRQLASFAYDTQTHTGYTAQDALESDPMDSVELSTRVHKAFRVLEPNAELYSTEMQGFLLNDDASTEFLYMRIEEEPDPENPADEATEMFYLYDPAVDAMAELDWPTT